MKTYPQYTEDNKLSSFEINNIFCSRKKATRVIETIPGVKVLRRPKRFLSWFREDVFCEFELGGATYLVEEPFGDNSRFWIGPLQKDVDGSIGKVLEAFDAA